MTPLNIVSALCLVAGTMMLFDEKSDASAGYPVASSVLAGLSFLAAVVFFVSDLIFRRLVLNLGKLWVIEGMVVVLMVMIIFILKTSS